MSQRQYRGINRPKRLTRTLTLRIVPGTYDRLAEEARHQTDGNMSDLVRALIAQGLNDTQRTEAHNGQGA